MKRVLIFLCFIFLIIGCGKSQESNIEIIQKEFKPLNIEISDRLVSIYLPSNYLETQIDYPV